MPEHAIVRQARGLIKVGRFNAAADLLRRRDAPSNGVRDILLAEALVGSGRHAAALNVAARRFLSDDPTRSRVRLSKVLLEAARVADPGLAKALASLALPQKGSRSEKVLKAFYFGGGLKDRSAGQRAVASRRKLGRALRRGRSIAQQECFIQFLKAYSSFTPLLASPNPSRLGGGYFLGLDGYGYVVDPGHHFLDNFFEAGRSIDDIDGVFVTHFHDDHFADLPALLSLLYQRSRSGGSRTVDLFFDEDTANIFAPMIEAPGGFLRLRKLRASHHRPIKVTDEVSLKALPTRHNVFGRSAGVGLAFCISGHTCLVITGDTGWDDEIAKAYRGLRGREAVLVAHVSTVYDNEALGSISGNGNVFHENHLCILGLCRAIEEMAPSAVILSEIGEELGDVVGRLSQLIGDAFGIPCEVGKVGLIHGL